jgi:hypothetical protein
VFKAKLKSKFKISKFKYGFKVSNFHLDAVVLDKLAGKKLWKALEASEINALDKNKVFKDLGKRRNTTARIQENIMLYDL